MSLLYARPSSLQEAVEELDDDEALLLAGGVSVVLLMNTGLLAPRKLVTLSRIGGIRGVEESDGEIRLGAMTTHEALARDPVLRSAVPCAGDVFGHIGNVRVRAWGTIGGNLAHADPAQDPPVLLAALDAAVVAIGPRGERRIRVSELADGPFSTVLAHDEIIRSVVLRRPPSSSRTAYIKLLPRTEDDYATVSAAASIDFDAAGVVRSAALVLGAVGPRPVVAEGAAALLVGQRADDRDVLDAVADDVRDAVRPTDDGRGSADYKRHVAGVTVRRTIQACTEAAA